MFSQIFYSIEIIRNDKFFYFQVCGGNINIVEPSHGIIASPGSPGNAKVDFCATFGNNFKFTYKIMFISKGKYPVNRDCYWKLIAPTNKRIHLHFFTLELETHEACDYDYLAVS